jgi:hypothetical protein
MVLVINDFKQTKPFLLKNSFIKMMSDDGKYNVVFDDVNTTPKLVEMSLPFLKT